MKDKIFIGRRDASAI